MHNIIINTSVHPSIFHTAYLLQWQASLCVLKEKPVNIQTHTHIHTFGQFIVFCKYHAVPKT